MTYHLDDTIAAIASAPGGAARGIVRVSGNEARAIVAKCFDAATSVNLESLRQPAAVEGTIRVELVGIEQRVPCALYFWPDRRSYTREPVAEFHTLGSPPIVQAVLDAVCRAGARLAAPGEFTLRAFLSGRIDLTQAEAVLGVIDAHDANDLRVAVEQLAGNLVRPLGQLREELLMLLAEVEAGLDFVEEDIEFITAEALEQRLRTICGKLVEMAATMTARGTAKSIGQVALVGAPNAGKSSLFNSLVERFGVDRKDGAAIVSDVRGTTRDYLVAEVEFVGQRVQLIDTAGVDDVEEQLAEVDLISRQRAGEQQENSLVRVWCVEAVKLLSAGSDAEIGLCAEVIAITKSDLAPARGQLPVAPQIVVTSSKLGEGIDQLSAAIGALLASPTVAVRTGYVAATAERCRESIRKATAAIERACEFISERARDELVAAEIRTALGELGKVVGAVYTDDLLDRIFSSFCIGK